MTGDLAVKMMGMNRTGHTWRVERLIYAIVPCPLQLSIREVQAISLEALGRRRPKSALDKVVGAAMCMFAPACKTRHAAGHAGHAEPVNAARGEAAHAALAAAAEGQAEVALDTAAMAAVLGDDASGDACDSISDEESVDKATAKAFGDAVLPNVGSSGVALPSDGMPLPLPKLDGPSRDQVIDHDGKPLGRISYVANGTSPIISQCIA